jgi:hypothetical protein
MEKSFNCLLLGNKDIFFPISIFKDNNERFTMFDQRKIHLDSITILLCKKTIVIDSDFMKKCESSKLKFSTQLNSTANKSLEEVIQVVLGYSTFKKLVNTLVTLDKAKPDLLRYSFIGFLGSAQIVDSQEIKLAEFLTAEGVLMVEGNKTFKDTPIPETEDCDSESNTESIFYQYETSENIEEREYITNEAVRIGFIRDKFAQWLSSISDDILATQTPEYWFLSYVSDLEINIWNEDSSPSAWLLSCFAITPETADIIVNSVSGDYLQNQTPQYWINSWITQQTNPISSEFKTFIEKSPANTLISYGEIPNILIVESNDVEELNLLLSLQSLQSCPSSDEHTYYFHTTNRNGAESIIKNGIHLGKCAPYQDFGRSSFYLNDEFRCATEWGRKRYLNLPNTCVILVYDIPSELLQRYHYLDLSQDLKKWKEVVRKSYNGLKSVADNYDLIYGPQTKNAIGLIKDKKVTPIPSSEKNQLAVKEKKLAEHVDKQLTGIIIYRTLE